ncbi:protein delta homolog 1-like [Branchiostoma lanceolatum]|uniref:protein delta homolog 1-like n=1 Tax=Branchiostoma lanceolatum TaxID=7740 RepID=UPI00345226EE
MHGGNCSSCFGGTDTVCACPAGYDGKFCENHAAIQWCEVASCPAGWTCDDQLTHFLCIEPGTRTGSAYQCSSASCPNDMYCKEEGRASFSCWSR